MIRVLVADDEPMIRAGARAILASDPGIEVVAEAGDGREAIELARRRFTFTDHQLLPQLDAAFALPDSLVTSVIGTVDPNRVIAAQRAYVTAFFDEHLRRRPQALLDGPSPEHPEVTFVP